MDVFLCTGERSGDVIAADIARELQQRAGGRLHIEGLAGPIAAAAGVRNVFGEDGLALVGAERHRLRAWAHRLKVVAGLLQRRPPKVFVGITHCTFNLPLGGLLPRQTYRMLVGPPEIWGWEPSSFARLVVGRPLSLLLWLRGDPFHWGHAALVTAERGPMALANFHELLCMLPMNDAAYRRLARRKRPGARVRMVGHPLAQLHRTPALGSQAAALRVKLGIPQSAHVLGIFPGSRRGDIRVMLDTLLEAAVDVLNRRSDVYGVVSVADLCLEGSVRGAIARAAERLRGQGQLLASLADASVLLAASSHALMASGTITLQAACLAAPGTVARMLPAHGLSVKFVRQAEVRGRKIPWSLPNAILATQGADPEDLPYREFVYRRFRAPWIAESVFVGLPRGAYRPDGPCVLDSDVVARIRAALQPSAEEGPAVAARPGAVLAVAETVLRRLGR